MTDFHTDEVVGYEVTITIRKTTLTTQQVKKHWVGTEARMRAKAKMVTNYVSIDSMEPITGRQWIRAYGNPHDRSKFS